MTEPSRFDESSLLWAAALVEGVDPAQLVPTMDVAALAAVVAEADAATDPVDAAATVLVGVVLRRPFRSANAAIGWLAAVDRLAGPHLRVSADPAVAVELCGAVRHGDAGVVEVAAALRSLLVEDGIACPACGRRVYADDPIARRFLMPGGTRFELMARCAFEHRSHDRAGRPIASSTGRPVEPSQPVVATGACGSFLVGGEAGGVAVTPFCDDPPLVRVVEVDDLRPGDLVGRWDELIERSTTLGYLAADEAAPDERGCVDLVRLRRALRAGRPPGIGVSGADAEHRVGVS